VNPPIAADNSRKSPFRAIAHPGLWGFADRKLAAWERSGMAKVLGIGGIFFKSKDPAALINW
jgi:hypothetical protein